MSEPADGPGNPDEQIGSVADEAAKLFGALSEWAHEHGSDLGHGLAATGSAECTYCPICRAAHFARQTSPEVRTHLAVAAASLMQAAAGILATAVPDEAREAAARGHNVEHIDLDDDVWPEEDQ